MVSAIQVEQLTPGTLWEHHSGSTYTVFALSRNTATNGVDVVYMRPGDEMMEFYNRPIGDFLGTVKIDGQYVRRFSPSVSKKQAEVNRLIPWSDAGGPNECQHGYAAGISCPTCGPRNGRKEE